MSAGAIWSLILSTIAYFVASHTIQRQMNEMDIPKGMSRSIIVFVLALGAAYAVAALTDWLFAWSAAAGITA